MASITSRRYALFAAAGSVVIGSGITAGAAASVADLAAPPGATSPIIQAGLQAKACWDRHDAAEDRDDREGVLAASEEKRRHEEFILASTPTTLAECALVLMIAVAEIDFGQNVDDGFDLIDAGERVCERVTHSLFALAGVDIRDFAGQFYIRMREPAPILAGRA